MGAWDDGEAKAFEAAMSAFSGLPDDAPSYMFDDMGNPQKAKGTHDE
jgi:hypothetical protein